MHLLEKPANRWGWARAASLILLALLLAWTLLAALLRAQGAPPALAWTGYQSFSILRGLQLAVAPLLAAGFSAYFERQHHAEAAEQRLRAQAEHAAAGQRKIVLQHVHAQLARTAGNPARVREVIEAALPDLDEKGRAALLQSLYEQGFLHAGDSGCVDLRGLDFRKANLHRAHLPGICLEGADLTGADLTGAHLAGARFTGACLRRARLRHAGLTRAALDGCDLTAARLEHAHLAGADLRGARMTDTILEHADLTGCAGVLTLDSSILIDTIRPDGQKVTNEKGKAYLRNKEIAAVVDRL